METRIPYYSRQELCNAVYAAVSASPQPMSRREISAAIGRKKNPHIIAMIEYLTATGYFEKEAGVDKLGRPTLFYHAAERSAPDCS